MLHVDMDAFFAAVEIKENPALSGLPVVVGGTGNRGVVASASYEARAFGIRSAMPAARARRLCPHLVFLPSHFELYHRYSERLHEVLHTFSPLVEGVGLDEAYLDLSGGGGLFGAPREIAIEVRRRVLAELDLSCSVGAGPNKLVAKLASKAAKPRPSKEGPAPGQGIVVIDEDNVLGFIWPMPVEALSGVGPANGARLHKLGVTTVRQLAALPVETATAVLGKAAGRFLHGLAWGRDPRPVVGDRAVKSIGHEETYPTDVVDREQLERRLVVMADSVAASVRQHGLVARTVTLKLRYGDFTTLTRSHTFASPQTSGPVFWTAAKALLHSLDLKGGARLLGLSASGLVPAELSPGEQLQLGLEPTSGPVQTAVVANHEHASSDRLAGASWAKASDAVDAVRARFGAAAVGPAVSLGELHGPEAGKEASEPAIDAMEAIDDGHELRDRDD
ncbi:MAG TPA: DNA polymerase IV [Acidimicrobiales bacterium]|nr:DNA polymerase IV [Acidimicrobiales bacterium]